MGVCSALFELGGMTVMHDASGCNSTYTTHDEPRWYDMDSMVYISGISEMEAIMGDDEKLISDIVDAANELHPKFIAIAGTPIPMMTGFDFEAVADVIEQRTGIPTFGFPTTGMNTYIHGASMAFAGIAKRFTSETGDGSPFRDSGSSLKVNILGLTPLDFSINGQDESIAEFLRNEGYEVISSWAMGSSLEEISRAADADVNLVVSAAGIDAANVLNERFGTPYVVGVPIGEELSYIILDSLDDFSVEDAATDVFNPYPDEVHCIVPVSDMDPDDTDVPGLAAVIGEGVMSLSIASAIELEIGMDTKVLCATECPDWLLRGKDRLTPDEDDIIPELADATVIIADPLYRPICPPEAKFIPLPSEAFSGRIYRDQIPDLIRDASAILGQLT